MIHFLAKTLIALFSGIKNLFFDGVPENETAISDKTSEKKNTHLWDGIVFLGCNFILAFVICILMEQIDPLNYTRFHTFIRALFFVSIPAIIVYVLSAWMFHFSPTGKTLPLVSLLILVNVSAFFTGRFIYHHSVKSVLSAIEKNNSQQIQAREKEIIDRIDVLSLWLQKEPEDRLQACEAVAGINEMIELHKEAHAININFQDSIFFAVKREPVLKPAELQKILKERMNMNVDAFSDFQYNYQIWYNATTKCLIAKKESYQSYIDDEDNGMQTFKMKKADDACSLSSEKLKRMTEAQSKFMGTNL